MEKIKLGLILIIGEILLSSCTHAILSPASFDAIKTGTEIREVEDLYGKPYEIKDLGSGLHQYCYIQKIEIAPGVTEQTNYFFRVVDGRVKSKQRQNLGSSVDFNYR